MRFETAKWILRTGVIGALILTFGGGCSGGSSGAGVSSAVVISSTEPSPNGTESVVASARRARTFVNPLLKQEAADPWMVRGAGGYLFTFTSGNSIQIWKADSIQNLSQASKVIVWRAPAKGPLSRDIWAPELHFLRGKWYLYFTATDGADVHRRLWVLEAKTDNPQGVYAVKAQLAAPREDEYAIDGDVLAQGDALYLLWSGRESATNSTQNIYIAPLSNPWTIGGPRVKISTPQYPWETHGWGVNEGPQALQHGGKTFITYSASGGSTPFYCLGLLSNPSGDLLSAKAWHKASMPVFSSYEGKDGRVYAPGHNSFTVSPDGTQNWIIYHAKEKKTNTWDGRLPRAQAFTWNADGSPNFGHPIPSGVAMPVPSG